jgi:hypothetical protein
MLVGRIETLVASVLPIFTNETFTSWLKMTVTIPSGCEIAGSTLLMAGGGGVLVAGGGGLAAGVSTALTLSEATVTITIRIAVEMTLFFSENMGDLL